MRNRRLTIIIQRMCPMLYGQKITIRRDVTEYSNYKAISQIAELQKSYVESYGEKNGKLFRNSMWLDDRRDILSKHGGSDLDGALYLYFNNHTFNIRKITDKLYEINTLAYSNYDGNNSFMHYYKVLAVESEDGFKFINYLDVNKEKLNRSVVGDIEYYYPKDFKFLKRDAKESAKFVADFKKTFGIIASSPITYMIGSNIQECFSMLGLPFTAFHSEKTYAGYTLYNIILSTRANHIHELVHGIVTPLYPNAMYYLSEGLATYY